MYCHGNLVSMVSLTCIRNLFISLTFMRPEDVEVAKVHFWSDKLYRPPSMLGRLLYRSGDFLKPSLRASRHWGRPRLTSRAAQPCTACIPARGLRPSEDKQVGQHGKAPCCNSMASLSRHSCPTSTEHLLLPPAAKSCQAPVAMKALPIQTACCATLLTCTGW